MSLRRIFDWVGTTAGHCRYSNGFTGLRRRNTRADPRARSRREWENKLVVVSVLGDGEKLIF